MGEENGLAQKRETPALRTGAPVSQRDGESGIHNSSGDDGKAGPVSYACLRGGRVVQVTLEPGAEAERRRWRNLGAKLHQQMAEAVKEAGLTLPEHPDDEDHNEAVGRALAMVATGQVREGAAFYCAWAKAHGYPGVEVIRLYPPQLDIGTAIVGGMIAELSDSEVTILSVGDWVRPGYTRVERSFSLPISLWGRLIVPVKGGSQ